MQNNHYKIGTPIYNQRYRQSLEANEDPLSVLFAKKIYKIKVRQKLVYYIELDYYEHTVFIKFYPKIIESEPSKFKKVGIGLKIAEIRKLLYTCCVLVYQEIQMNPQKVFSFVAQIYDRDNLLKRKKVSDSPFIKKWLQLILTIKITYTLILRRIIFTVLLE